MFRVKKPSNHRAKLFLENREPKFVENVKKAMFIHGRSGSQLTQTLVRDLALLKKPDAVGLRRKNDIRPFEDVTSVEFLSQKNDCSLFTFDSSNKKRPHSIIFGRLFDHHILDMIELGVVGFKSILDFKNAKKQHGSKPLFVFNGEYFEQKEEYRVLKNLMLDFFRGEAVKSIDLTGLDCVISVTATEDKIYFRVYNIHMKKSGTRLPRVELEECGPSVDFVMRRTKLAGEDVRKESMRVPKEVKPKNVKNVETDPMGHKVGRIHTDKLDLSGLQTRKVKALKKDKRPAPAEEDGEHGDGHDQVEANSIEEKTTRSIKEKKAKSTKTHRSTKRARLESQ